jgi:hypothetical protein
VRIPTSAIPNWRQKSAYFWLLSALSGVVYAIRCRLESAWWIANSAIRVFPAPVGAETMTDSPSRMARIARA